MLALLVILAQTSEPLHSAGGFKSSAALHNGSGAADFACGNTDELPDGGWGSGSRYCVVQTEMTPSYNGDHGDLTITAKWYRYAGYLLHVTNPLFGPVFKVNWKGDVWAYGTYYATGNGGGFRNEAAYAAVYGFGSTALPDVVVGAVSPHANGRPTFGVWTGYSWAFQVRDDGALRVADQTLRVSTNNDALYITQELPDGGERMAIVPWFQ